MMFVNRLRILICIENSVSKVLDNHFGTIYDALMSTNKATENNMATYGYLRVSTEGKGQTTDNQRKLIQDAGYAVTEFFSEDGVSGSIKATERPAFSAMLSKMQKGDTLVITMVDRLGRTASDILNVVEMFKAMGVRVCVLQFEGMDITGSMGKMVLTCMAAMAELERNILIERTKAGMERTKAQGTKIGRPLAIHPKLLAEMCAKKAQGMTFDDLTEQYKLPRMTIARNISKWKDCLDEYSQEWESRKEQYERKAA